MAVFTGVTVPIEAEGLGWGVVGIVGTGVVCPVGMGAGMEGTGSGIEGTGDGMYGVPDCVGCTVGKGVPPGVPVPTTEGVAFTPCPGLSSWQLPGQVLATILETCPLVAVL